MSFPRLLSPEPPARILPSFYSKAKARHRVQSGTWPPTDRAWPPILHHSLSLTPPPAQGRVQKRLAVRSQSQFHEPHTMPSSPRWARGPLTSARAPSWPGPRRWDFHGGNLELRRGATWPPCPPSVWDQKASLLTDTRGEPRLGSGATGRSCGPTPSSGPERRWAGGLWPPWDSVLSSVRWG